MGHLRSRRMPTFFCSEGWPCKRGSTPRRSVQYPPASAAECGNSRITCISGLSRLMPRNVQQILLTARCTSFIIYKCLVNPVSFSRVCSEPFCNSRCSSASFFSEKATADTSTNLSTNVTTPAPFPPICGDGLAVVFENVAGEQCNPDVNGEASADANQARIRSKVRLSHR
jgi:hypothetical protein